jgi:SAM-dependent methyltransferase
VLKELAKRIVPRGLLVAAYRKLLLPRMRRANACRSVGEVFTRIYMNNEWGGKRGEFYSGSGSSEFHAAKYAEAVRGFIRGNGVRTVVDLGCGDFVVGRQLAMPGVRYIGVDVVEELVSHNQREYGNADTSFQFLDIIEDELPDGDLCLLRQVLQHLSNAQIGKVLAKVRRYPFALITEHYPGPSVAVVPNKDKPHGSDTRIYDGSAVYLDRPPFSLEGLELVLEMDAVDHLVSDGETLRTFLARQRAGSTRAG